MLLLLLLISTGPAGLDHLHESLNIQEVKEVLFGVVIKHPLPVLSLSILLPSVNIRSKNVSRNLQSHQLQADRNLCLFIYLSHQFSVKQNIWKTRGGIYADLQKMSLNLLGNK
ncbi:hypothetical protein CEXT_484421 [Caerostris extrusa]|uniref:Uncharacterized protein n=1 Tax=Caerostris extrusa TaxID=172846 RepID=A0AAV4Y6N9_CAEEX|nr:hypothetical protein CEXT_484421 [Caerostris extrusa]